MFLKQTAYKPRQNSQEAPASNTDATSAVDTTTSTASSAAIAGRRRSSAAGAEKFAGLRSYKRSSQDVSAQADKAGFADQKPGNPGVLGSMWNNFTKGS